MSSLEDAVKTLAGALDTLEQRLDERLHDLGDQSDAVDAARRQSRAAKGHAGEASDHLAAAIGDLKTMLNEPAPAGDNEE